MLLRARAKGGRLLVAQVASTSARVAAVAVLVSVAGLRGAGWGLVIGSGVAAFVFWTQVALMSAREPKRRDIGKSRRALVLGNAYPGLGCRNSPRISTPRRAMTIADRPSVALLTNAPAPYRTPFFNELSKHCRLLVAFETRRLPGREWAVDEREFEFQCVLTRALSIPRPSARYGFRRVLHVPLNVVSVLNHFQPDVVVSDGLGARTASAVAFCRLRKRPLIVWWEGTPHTEDGTSALRAVLRRKLLQRATRAWGNGEECAKSLAAYGVPRSRIDLGMTGTDTLRWRREVEDARGATRSALREQHGLRGTVVLFVGRLTALKGVRSCLRR